MFRTWTFWLYLCFATQGLLLPAEDTTNGTDASCLLSTFGYSMTLLGEAILMKVVLGYYSHFFWNKACKEAHNPILYYLCFVYNDNDCWDLWNNPKRCQGHQWSRFYCIWHHLHYSLNSFLQADAKRWSARKISGIFLMTGLATLATIFSTGKARTVVFLFTYEIPQILFLVFVFRNPKKEKESFLDQENSRVENSLEMNHGRT